MKLFYGWVLVGAAMVITCVGYDAMFSLGVFLQPMAAVEGWSRTGISTAVAIALTFRPPRQLPAGLPSPSLAH